MKKLMNKIMKMNDYEIITSLISHLKSDEKFLKASGNKHPSIIALWEYTKPEIPSFWNEKIGSTSNIM